MEEITVYKIKYAILDRYDNEKIDEGICYSSKPVDEIISRLEDIHDNDIRLIKMKFMEGIII